MIKIHSFGLILHFLIQNSKTYRKGSKFTKKHYVNSSFGSNKNIR